MVKLSFPKKKYLCDAAVSPEAVKVELKKTFSETDAARLALSFKTVQEIDRMCNQDAKTGEYLDKLSVLKFEGVRGGERCPKTWCW